MSEFGDTWMGEQTDWVLENLGWVRGLCLRVVGHADLAEDVSQEVWVRLIKTPPPAGVATSRWIAGVVKKVALELRRKEQAGKRREVMVAVQRQRDSDTRMGRQLEVERDVVEHVKALDAPYRRVILLRYFEQLSVEEIAGTEGLSASGVRSRLHRAVEQLRDRLREKPTSAAGAFFGAVLPKANVAATGGSLSGSAKGAGSLAAWWSAKGLLMAGLLMVIIAGVLLNSTLRTPEVDDVAARAVPGVELAAAGAALTVVDAAAGDWVASREATVGRSKLSSADSQGAEGAGVLADADAGLELTLQFVDAAGAPLTDLPLAVIRRPEKLLLSRKWMGVTDASDGQLRVSKAELMDALDGSEDSVPLVDFYIDAPGHLDAALTLNLDEATADPILTVIDTPMGALVLRAQHVDGSPHQEEVMVRLNTLDRDTIHGRFSPSLKAGLATVVRGIPIGQRIIVSPETGGGLQASMQFLEPLASHGEVVEVPLVFRSQGPVIMASLVLPDGAILGDPAGTSVVMKVGLDPVDGRVKVDHSGRLTVLFRGTFEAGAPCEFTFRTVSKRDRASVVGATVDGTIPADGIPLDLGRVQLESRMRTVHGRVFDRSGAPCPGASVWVGRETKSAPGNWFAHSSERQTTGADGRFSIAVPDDGARYALCAGWRRTSTKSSYVLVSPGAEAMELHLRSTATVAGRVVVPDGLGLSMLYVAWCPAGSGRGGLTSPSSVSLEGDRAFSLIDIPEGAVDVALFRNSRGEPISWRRDIEVPEYAGTVTLADWVLAYDLVPLQFTIGYPKGVEPTAVVLIDGDSALVSGDAYDGWAPPGGANLIISSEGCRTYFGATARVGAVVKLEPAYVISFDLELPAGWRLGLDGELAAQIRLAELDVLGSYSTRVLPPRMAKGFTRPVSRVVPISADGRLQFLACSPGAMKLNLMLGDSGNSRQIEASQLPPSLREIRITIEPDEPVQHFRLDLSH